VAGMAERRRAAAERALADLAGAAETALAEAGRKLEAMARNGRCMPAGVMRALQSIV
jgi:hypothetical protein